MSRPWPAWLTPEYGALHDHIEQQILSALEHCYASADAAGMNWTTEGWISCSASNILSWLRQRGFDLPADAVERPSTSLTLRDIHREWAQTDESERGWRFVDDAELGVMG